MRKSFILIIFIIGIVLCGLTTVSASDNDNLTQSDALPEANLGAVVNFDANDVDLYYKNGTKLQAGLLDSKGQPIANHKVGIEINGIVYNRTTGSDGKFSLPINLNPGIYSANLIFKATGEYYDCNKNVTVKVLPTISGDNVTKYFKNGTQYYAQFLDGQGNPSVGEKVSFNINGVFYYRTTDDKGMAKLNINLNPGQYILTAINSKGFQYSNIINVLPTIIASDVTKYIEGPMFVMHNFADHYSYCWVPDGYCAKFVDGRGNPLVGANVTFNVDGQLYDNITDNEGKVSLTPFLRMGNNTITIYNHNDGCCLSNNIDVREKIWTNLNSSDFTSSDEITNISVRLYDKSGNNLSNETIFLDVYPNYYIIPTNIPAIDSYLYRGSVNLGSDFDIVRYNATTDSNGVAVFQVNLTVGDSGLRFIFNGSTQYSGTKTTYFVTRLDGELVRCNVFFTDITKNDTYDIYVRDSEGNPLKNVSVVLNVENITYTTVSDERGIARFKLNLTHGYYNTIFHVNQTGYCSNHATGFLNFFDSLEFNVTNLVNPIYANMNSIYKIQFKSGDLEIANQDVIISINGVNYTSKTDDEGCAEFIVNLPPGNYTVLCRFDDRSKFSKVPQTLNLTIDTGVEIWVPNYNIR